MEKQKQSDTFVCSSDLSENNSMGHSEAQYMK